MRQKRDVVLVVFSVILLLLIAGCKGGKPDGGAPTTPFMGGTQGLEISFLEGLPPDEVTDGSSFGFNAIVRLKNLGEYDLKLGQVKASLVGFLPSDFDVDVAKIKDKSPDSDPTPRKRDAEGTIIEPVETFVTFPSSGEFNFKKPIPGNTPFIFRADVCYRYQTKAVSEICVLEDMVRIADDAICIPTGDKTVFSSGSPMQVNSFRESYAGKSGNNERIQFSFDIVDSGSGDIFDSTTDANCPKASADRRAKEDIVKITVDTGLATTGGALSCVGLTAPTYGTTSVSGSVKLINGKRTLTCTQTIPAGTKDFKKSVSITLDFNYLSSADKEVLVKRLLTS
mgnify:CR=1 FL=1